MELTYVTIVVLASMIFVLSGMVGYLYWQQTRMLQHLQSLAMVVANQVSDMQQQADEAEPEVEEELESEPVAEVQPVTATAEDEEEDDRLSVEEVEGPSSKDTTQPLDIDDLSTKTVVQLRDILTQRGIPFGKRDSKTILLQLLKATA